MGIMMVTSINAYAKSMQMAMKWQKKLEEKTAPDEAAQEAFQKKLDELRQEQDDRSLQTESDIELKMTSGKRLSSEEMLYLKNHDRSIYQAAKQIEQERIVYEDALAACTTKAEVEQLKADYAATAVKRINAIRNDPSISDEKKRSLFRIEHFRAAALDDAMHMFMDSADYKQLPEGEAPQPDETGAAEVSEKGAERTDPEKPIPAQEEAAADAAEEGSIMKAILDEEARWAREAEVEAEADPGPAQSEQGEEGSYLARAKAAYLVSQSYEAPAETSRSKIDIRK